MADKKKNRTDISTKVVSSPKRLTVLNEQQHLQLRRKIGVYSKIHEKELSHVERQLGEIKKEIKTMSSDNLLGSRVLDRKSNQTLSLPPTDARLSESPRKLMRAHSLPSLIERDKLVSPPTNERKLQEMKETEKPDASRKKSDVDENEKGRFALSQQKSHRKVTRSLTTPGTFPQPPQPLIKTTPELVKRKFNQKSSLHRELSRSHSGENEKLSTASFPSKMPVLVRHQTSSMQGAYSSTPQTPLRTQTAELIKLELNVEKQRSSPITKNYNERAIIARNSNNDNERQMSLQAKYSTTWNKREKDKPVNSK